MQKTQQAQSRQEGGLRISGAIKPRGEFRDSGTDAPPPLVSVITVAFNAAQLIESAIHSVRQLQYPNVEYIVIDGGSRDGTVDLLRANSDAVDYWLSEPDDGIYDAMNKGLDLVRGHYVYFLGADDVLLTIPDALADRRYDLVCGDVDCVITTFHAPSLESARRGIRYRNTIHPQGCFYARDSIRYDSRYRYCADYLFNIEYLACCQRFLRIPTTIARFNPSGASAGNAAKLEVIRIAGRQFGLMAMLQSCVIHLGSAVLSVARRRTA